MIVFLKTKGVNQMMYMMGNEEMPYDTERTIVPDGKKDHASIFELEGQFANDGHAQGSKFNREQRMRTMGY